jgi:hypothetical protein
VVEVVVLVAVVEVVEVVGRVEVEVGSVDDVVDVEVVGRVFVVDVEVVLLVLVVDVEVEVVVLLLVVEVAPGSDVEVVLEVLVDVLDVVEDDVEVVVLVLVVEVAPGSDVEVVLDVLVEVVELVVEEVDVVEVVTATVVVVDSSVVEVLVDDVELEEDELLLVVVEVVVVKVVVVEVLVVVVVVGHPQVKVPGTAMASWIGWLSPSATIRFSMSRAIVSPGVQVGIGLASRMVAIAPVPGAIDPPPKFTRSTLITLSADTSLAEQEKSAVRGVQSAWTNVSSSGVSRSFSWRPRTAVGGASLARSIGTSMSVAPGSAQRSVGRLTVTPARVGSGVVRPRTAATARMWITRLAKCMTTHGY